MTKLTYNDIYIRNRSVHPGETVIDGGVQKTCKLNLVRISNELYPADYCSISGWTYYDIRNQERRQIPDGAEIIVECDYPSRQVAALQEFDSYLLNVKQRLGI